MELYCVVGDWKPIGESQWTFCVDQTKNASTFEIGDVNYEDLLEMIVEDFELQNEQISLTYGFSLSMNSKFEVSPPVCVKNDRHLKSFINKIKEFSGISRLCVKVSDNMSLAPADNVGSNNQPSRGSNITQGEEQIEEALTSLPITT